ncbi:MAG: hypothetical protein C0511_01095 [Hyphomicrobium sp.]|nr:hypothetical protein [Hyphomicrobium sp.]PPC83963.1 MAG: hypothetical protein CTY40_01095 [Hyphomicrobium sp.]PPD12578.1 MAG: hypothetical protein CTY30_09315 [Methylocystis sp.]
MSLIADILFLAVVLGLFILIFWRLLGGRRRGRSRGTDAADREAATDYAAAQPHQGRRSGQRDGHGADDGGGGDGGGD